MSRMQEILDEAARKTIKVWVSEDQKKAFEEGAVVQASVWGIEQNKSLIEFPIRGSQCFSMFRNGRPFIRKVDWTLDEMDNFDLNAWYASRPKIETFSKQ
jgi:hypothetical protein